MGKQACKKTGWVARSLCLLGLLSLGVAFTSGCQTSIGGQTLPSAYYLEDDVQYFPTGPEFLLANEVRAIEQYKAERGELKAETAPSAKP